jgi:protein-tyrosine phosphatase
MILEVLKLIAGPLALTGAYRADQSPSEDAQQVVAGLGDSVQLVLDDGRTRYGQPSSVVRVLEHGFEVVRPGVVSEQTLKRLSSLVVLFVCTGNTCRSPMAESIFRKLVADRLGCVPTEVQDQGVLSLSAGIAAMMGSRPSPEAVMVMREMGLDLADHTSQPLSERLVQQSDLIFVMTRSHRQAILSEWPNAAERLRLICHDRSDVSDPIGGTPDQYAQCAEQIKGELEVWMNELKL